MSKEIKSSIIILLVSVMTIIMLPSKYEVIVAVLASITAASIGYLLKSIIVDFNLLKLIFSIYFKRTGFIRFSISYLYRIENKGKFLLVRSNRIKDYFQPVGGAYKYFENASEKFNKWDIRKDDKIKVDDKSDGDLRLQVPKKNVLKFLHWYRKAENREISCNREFYEELIQDDILSKENFPYVQYRKIKERTTGLQYSKYFKCWEILIFDIVEPVLNDAQKKEIEELYKKGNSENHIWADAQMIESEGHNLNAKEHEYRFGTQTKYII